MQYTVIVMPLTQNNVMIFMYRPHTKHSADPVQVLCEPHTKHSVEHCINHYTCILFMEHFLKCWM